MELLSVVIWLIWPSIAAVTAYWYFTKNYGYWKNLGVPSAPTVPLIGSLFSSLKKPMQDVELELYQKLGRIYGVYEGQRPALTVAEPDLLRNILVKDFQFFVNRRKMHMGNPINDNMLTMMEGEDWKRVRTIITPTFTTGKIKRMSGIFKGCAKTVCQNFAAAAKDAKCIDAKPLFAAYTMDVIASSAFSTKIDSHKDPNNQFVRMGRKIVEFNWRFIWRFLLFFLCPSVVRFFKISLFAPEALLFFKDVTLQIIQERKRTGQVRNDFLQMMLETAKDELSKEEESESAKTESEDIVSNYGTEDNNEVFKQYQQKKALSHDEMVAQCVNFFVAGNDTIASTLSFVCYNLALNQDCQDRLLREIDENVQEADGQMTYEAIQSMKYLDNVISESMRLYPPAIRFERIADEDYKLGDTGITIPKGMIVGVPVYAMLRDPEFFPDPEKFDPERFSPEAKAARNPYTYLPFGAGPRNCVGMRFALMEVKFCLAYVLSHFRVRRCAETKVPLEWNKGAGILHPKSIDLKMEIRNDVVLKS